MTTTARTGLTLDLRRADRTGAARYATKANALEALTVLRDRGLNLATDIEVNRAEVPLARFWVITRPDHHEVVTYVMAPDGSWLPGRLTDAPPCFCPHPCRTPHGAPWTRLPRESSPAPVTHAYRYSAGSTGVLGSDGKPLMSSGGLFGQRPVELLAWLTKAWCIACTWVTHGSEEDSVRRAGRHHRDHPETHPDHDQPRRTGRK